MTPEGKIVQYLKQQVKALGGATRKCEWSNHVGAPDQLVLLPGRHFWIELKAPGKKPRTSQTVEHRILRSAGCAVYVADSVRAVDEILFREYRESVLCGSKSLSSA